MNDSERTSKSIWGLSSEIPIPTYQMLICSCRISTAMLWDCYRHMDTNKCIHFPPLKRFGRHYQDLIDWSNPRVWWQYFDGNNWWRGAGVIFKVHSFPFGLKKKKQGRSLALCSPLGAPMLMLHCRCADFTFCKVWQLFCKRGGSCLIAVRIVPHAKPQLTT